MSPSSPALVASFGAISYTHIRDGQVSLNLREIIGPGWEQARFIQFVFPADTDVELQQPVQRTGNPRTSSEPVQAQQSGGLETIEEVSEPPTSSDEQEYLCLLYTSPSPRDGLLSRMPSSA